MVAHLDRVEGSTTGQTTPKTKSVKRSHSEDDRHQFRHALKDQMDEESKKENNRPDSDELILTKDEKEKKDTKKAGDEVKIQGIRLDETRKTEKTKAPIVTDHIDVKA